MYELHNFIGNTSYDNIEWLVKPLNITVKEMDNLYMLSFTDDADFTNPIVRQANGTIFEKDTNKIVHYAFEKCYDDIDNEISKDTFYSKDLTDNYTVELYFEGSIIKLYYYDNEWRISTSRYIDADRNFWSSKKSFKKLFIEALYYTYNISSYEEYLNTLDTKCTYTLLMQHPENNLINSSSVPLIYNINRINMENQLIIEERIEKDVLSVSSKLDELDRITKNYMLYKNENDGKVTRIKLLCKKFLELKELRGNYPDIGLSYLEYLNDLTKQEQLIKLFPNDLDKFEKIDNMLKNTCKNIHNLYYQIYINKNNINIPKYYEQTIKQLHGQYRKYKLPITLNDVIDKVTKLNTRAIAFVLQYKN